MLAAKLHLVQSSFNSIVIEAFLVCLFKNSLNSALDLWLCWCQYHYSPPHCLILCWKNNHRINIARLDSLKSNRKAALHSGRIITCVGWEFCAEPAFDQGFVHWRSMAIQHQIWHEAHSKCLKDVLHSGYLHEYNELVNLGSESIILPLSYWSKRKERAWFAFHYSQLL